MNKIVLSVLLASFPLYRFITWLIILNQFENETQLFKQHKFHEYFFMGFNINETIASIFSIFLIFLAFFALSKVQEPKPKYIQFFMIVLLSLLLLANVWTIL